MSDGSSAAASARPRKYGAVVRKKVDGVVIFACLYPSAKAGVAEDFQHKNANKAFDCFGQLPDFVVMQILRLLPSFRSLLTFRLANKRFDQLAGEESMPPSVPCYVRPRLGFVSLDPNLQQFLTSKPRFSNLLFSREQYEYFVRRFMVHLLRPWAKSEDITLDLSNFRGVMVEFYVHMFSICSGSKFFEDGERNGLRYSQGEAGLTPRYEFRPWDGAVPCINVGTLALSLDAEMRCFRNLAVGFPTLRRLVMDGSDPKVVFDLFEVFEQSRCALPCLEHFQWNMEPNRSGLLPKNMISVLRFLINPFARPLKTICMDGHQMGVRLFHNLTKLGFHQQRLLPNLFALRHLSLRVNKFTFNGEQSQMFALVHYIYDMCSSHIDLQLLPRTPAFDQPLVVHVCERSPSIGFRHLELPNGAQKLNAAIERVKFYLMMNDARFDVIERYVRFEWDSEGTVGWNKRHG